MREGQRDGRKKGDMAEEGGTVREKGREGGRVGRTDGRTNEVREGRRQGWWEGRRGSMLITKTY